MDGLSLRTSHLTCFLGLVTWHEQAELVSIRDKMAASPSPSPEMYMEPWVSKIPKSPQNWHDIFSDIFCCINGHYTWVIYLEKDFSGHGEAMCNDGFFLRKFPLPAVKFQTTAARQQTLAVHLRRGHAGKLTSCGRVVVRIKCVLICFFSLFFNEQNICDLSGMCYGRT